jgi:hypothetical protein
VGVADDVERDAAGAEDEDDGNGDAVAADIEDAETAAGTEKVK